MHLHYDHQVTLRLRTPDKMSKPAHTIVRPITDRPIQDIQDLLKRLEKLERLGEQVAVSPDAEQYVQRALTRRNLHSHTAQIRKDPAGHPLRTGLLKTPLLLYQLDGIAFATSTGRAILADDMGLGKTIQGIGTAELLRRKAGIGRVVIICPATLKAQWLAEVERFSKRKCQLVVGSAADRVEQYDNDCFFTICNYEQVLKNILTIEQVKWNLLILDEGQRIKNWHGKTSAVIKGLNSPFALVLSGTPMENRIDELYSVVQFIDDRRLVPAFRFFNHHRVVDEKGKVIGYKNLADLRRKLEPILLRRTRQSVMKQLPPRTTEVVRIAPTEEQVSLHRAHMQTISMIVNKAYITEMDLLCLRTALLMCRMSADNTFLVDKEPPGYSSKLAELEELLDRLLAEEDRKIVLFSEWTTMLGLIEPMRKKRKVDYVRLDGSVPQTRRRALVNHFQQDRNCKLFITTNAGSTRLNLQAANTGINVDLPWNPAVVQQRIGRAHRMGQKRPVYVFILVTLTTIEENLLKTLAAKQELAMAALDSNSKVDSVNLESGMDELKRRLEVLLGARPEAPLDQIELDRHQAQTDQLERRRRIAAAGQLVSAAVTLLDQIVPPAPTTESSKQVARLLKQQMADCVQKDENGQAQLAIALPDASTLDHLADALTRLVAARAQAPAIT